MSAMDPARPDREAEELEPRLAAIVSAILDGEGVDWSSVADSDSSSFRDELRIIADVAGIHRSLASTPGFDEAPPFPPQLPWQAGTLTITESLGKGAFGEVFRAWDTQLHRDVALKLLFRDRGRDDEAERFLEEGRLLAKVRHPNVITVYGAERLEGRVALVTEFIDGRTLGAVVRTDGPLPVDQLQAIGVALCRALAAVNAAGLLHRDIKPQNVMRDADGRVVLMDFGAGHRADAAAHALAGTPLFLAPEVLDGAPATIRSDVYSLGVLLHYLATGGYPVTGSSLGEIRENHRGGRRTLLRSGRPALPRRIADAIDRATDPDPRRRYASAEAFEAALARSVHLPVRRRALTWGAGAIAATLVAAAVANQREWISLPGIIRAGGDFAGGTSRGAGDIGSTTVRHLPLTGSAFVGRPSRDGRWIPYSDAGGNLWTWEIGTQQARPVTASEPNQSVTWGSLMSPDGQRIAYSWEGAPGVQLRVIDADGTHPATIWPLPGAGGNTAGIVPLDWSRDGEQILHLLERQDGSSDLALIRSDGSDYRVLASFRTGAPRQGSLSPDGRLVVFDLPASDRATDRDLMVVRADGSSPVRPLLTGATNDLHPSWTPDGNGIFFVSNRSGQMSGWLLPMAGEQIAGDPTFVARNLGRIWPLGLTDTGAYFYQLQVGGAEVYTVTVDLTGATRPGSPAPVSESEALDHLGAAWSPDGRSLAYISQSKETAWDRGSHSVVIQDLASRATRQLHVAGLSRLGVVSPRWSPDSRQLLVRGIDIENREGLFIVDAGTGTIQTSIPVGSLNRFDWSVDGQSVVYGRRFRQIVSHAIATGRETVLFDISAHDLERVAAFAFTPDGRTLGFSGMRRDKRWALFTYSAGGTLNEIHASERQLVFQAWSPDAAQLLFTVAGQPQPHRLMRIHATGGAPVDMGVTINGFPQVNRVVLNPDGTRIAYTAGEPGVQLWVMERFLPR